MGMVLFRGSGQSVARADDSRAVAGQPAWAIGTLAGAAVLVNGITRIAIAGKIRSGVGQFERAVKDAA
jgi:hypothetical protein